MKKFRLHWLDGYKEVVEGIDVADAYRRAGIGNGALPAIDYFEEITERISVQCCPNGCVFNMQLDEVVKLVGTSQLEEIASGQKLDAVIVPSDKCPQCIEDREW